MVMLALLSLLTGMVLGMRSKVLILVPATACAVPIAIAIGVESYNAFGLVLLLVAAAVVSLQIGYLAGVRIRYALAVARIGSLHHAPNASSQTARRVAH